MDSSTNTTPHKLERIDLRTTKEVKELLTRAAGLSMMPLSAFLLHSACERAQHVLAEQETIVLSDQERDRFIELLENPPEPNAKLQKAMQRYHDSQSA